MRNLSILLMMSLVVATAFGGPGHSEERDSAATQPSPAAFEHGRFQWRTSVPLLGPDTKAADPQVSIKDPTVVYHEGRWHLFSTVRMRSGKVDIAYLNFVDWSQAEKAPRHLLNLHNNPYGKIPWRLGILDLLP